MPRNSRLIICDSKACYHIMVRGNQKQKIFFENKDYEKYVETLKHYKKRYRFFIYAFCLMPNHVHLIIEPNNMYGTISKIMQGINLTYCSWFNSAYNKVGHLWQGRFKSYVIIKDEYLMNCLNYVELNPVRSEIASSPLDYKWSSYRYRVLGIKNNMLDIPSLEDKMT